MLWENLKTYCKEHKPEIILIGLGAVCIGTGVALGVRYRKNSVLDRNLIGQEAKSIEATPYNVIRNPEFYDAVPITRSGYNHPFDVSSHIRTLPNGWNASLEKQAAAKAMGITLEPGQTLVNGYVKGNLAA